VTSPGSIRRSTLQAIVPANDGPDVMTVRLDQGDEPQLRVDESQPYAPQQRPASTEAPWRVVPGPTGKGRCLGRDESEAALLLIAPPGTPLQLPEDSRLNLWRSALWQDGRISGDVHELAEEELDHLAGSKRMWIDEQNLAVERREFAVRRRDDADDLDSTTTGPHPTVALLPALQTTQRASMYSALVASQSPDNPIARVERLASRKLSIAEMSRGLEDVANVVGADQKRELVVALLHARARSHSWRCTKPLRIFERREPLERTMEREIDSVKTGADLLARLRALELQVSELDRLLVVVLYRRARSPRWLITWPLRRLLGARRLEALRRRLRGVRVPPPERTPTLPPVHPA
jgi:hypothetical protein